MLHQVLNALPLVILGGAIGIIYKKLESRKQSKLQKEVSLRMAVHEQSLREAQEETERLRAEVVTLNTKTECFKTVEELESLIESNKKESEEIASRIEELKKSESTIASTLTSRTAEIDELREEESKCRRTIEELTKTKARCLSGFDEALEAHHTETINRLDTELEIKHSEIEGVSTELGKIVHSLTAATRQKRIEQEKLQELELYKLKLTEEHLKDIVLLNRVRSALNNKEVLSKLIWTTYFQKGATELCNRVVGTGKVCGIYKITNLEDGKIYIGQSVDVSNRLKSHIKCGLGIGGAASNKLYSSMLQEGVWNFTFEKVEECPKEDLDERERFWISTYESNLYGYNSTIGG